MSSPPRKCIFEHSGLMALEGVVFRLTEGDRVAALALKLDTTEAVVPVSAVSKLFGIAPDSADGALLRLIGEALNFVPALRIGDELPAEVLTGEASWQPSGYHREVASARLQMQLLGWIGGGGADQNITPQMLVASVDDPSIRPRVQDALRRAAEQLGVTGGGPAVAALIEELSGELAYIEALRERLLVRVQGLARGLSRLAGEAVLLTPARRETLLQVSRLAVQGLGQVSARFEQVDGQTKEILEALRNLERQRSFLRPNRNWLYTTQIAWHPHLQAWEAIPAGATDERLWKALDRLYRFLAPRYMLVKEWQGPKEAGAAEKGRVLVW